MKQNIAFQLPTTPAEREEATGYVRDTDRELMINSFEEIPAEIDRLVAEAYIAGARSRAITVTPENFDRLRDLAARAISDGGFGTVGYDSRHESDIAEEVLEAIGITR